MRPITAGHCRSKQNQPRVSRNSAPTPGARAAIASYGSSHEAGHVVVQPASVAFRGRVFGSMRTTGALLMLAGTAASGAVGGILGPIALLNFQGGAYVVAGLVVLALLGAHAVAPDAAAEPVSR